MAFSLLLNRGSANFLKKLSYIFRQRKIRMVTSWLAEFGTIRPRTRRQTARSFARNWRSCARRVGSGFWPAPRLTSSVSTRKTAGFPASKQRKRLQSWFLVKAGWKHPVFEFPLGESACIPAKFEVRRQILRNINWFENAKYLALQASIFDVWRQTLWHQILMSTIGSCPNQLFEWTLAGSIHLRWVIKRLIDL